MMALRPLGSSWQNTTCSCPVDRAKTPSVTVVTPSSARARLVARARFGGSGTGPPAEIVRRWPAPGTNLERRLPLGHFRYAPRVHGVPRHGRPDVRNMSAEEGRLR